MKTIARFGRSLSFDVYFLFQALLPVFARPASVVLNTSIGAHVGAERSSVYAATKAAFLSMAKTLSSELLGRGIRVNAVSPGRSRLRCTTNSGSPTPTASNLTRTLLQPSRSAASARPRRWPRLCCTWLPTNPVGRSARKSSLMAAPTSRWRARRSLSLQLRRVRA